MQADTLSLLAEEAAAELWRRGDLAWLLRPEQAELKKELEKPWIQLGVWNICRRFGKTFTLVVYAIEQAIKRRQKIRYGCAFRSDLEEFILPAFELILATCPPDLRPRFIASKSVWRFPNGSEIKLVGLDKNPNGLRGNGIAIIIVDEAGYVTHLRRIYTGVIIPATAKQKGIKVVFLSTPPETPDHYFVELITKAKTRSNGFYAEMTIDDISDMPPEERKRLLDEVGGEESVEARREFFCKIIIDPRVALCSEFDAKIHVKALSPPKFAKFWVSGDTGGVRDKTVLHLMCYDFERAKVMVLAEVACPVQTATETWVPLAKVMEGQKYDPERKTWSDGRRVTRHIDAPGQTQLDLMQTYAYPCALPRKDELEATVNQVRTAARRGEFEIDPSCTLLILTLEAGTLNKQRTDLNRTEALGHMDAFMSFVYGLRHANKDNPFPAYGGASPYTHYIKPASSNNPTGNALKKAFKGPT